MMSRLTFSLRYWKSKWQITGKPQDKFTLLTLIYASDQNNFYLFWSRNAAIEKANNMSEGIRNFLASVGLERYYEMFVTRGFDEESDIPYLSITDLNCIGICDPSEVATILKAAMAYQVSSEHELFCWLRNHGLAHYWEGFVQSQLTELSQLAQLNLPDEDLYDELEITLPGHKHRFERAVSKLHKRHHQSSLSNAEVVTEGWWGYPEYLHNAKYPFLCVQATIRSTIHNSAPPHQMDFMVDSGSDVSTLRDDVIQSLQLEAMGTVKSCGVYGSQKTTMYRALLTIGDTQLEIEMISSSYDSLGSRVLRHFRHQIDSSRHTWLRGTRPILRINEPENPSRLSVSTATNGPPETVPVLSGSQARDRVSDEHPGPGQLGSSDTDSALDEGGTSEKNGLGPCEKWPPSRPSYEHDHGYVIPGVAGESFVGSKNVENCVSIASVHVTGAHSKTSTGTSTSQQNREVSTKTYGDAVGSKDVTSAPENDVPDSLQQGHVICANDVIQIIYNADVGDGHVMPGALVSQVETNHARSNDVKFFTNASRPGQSCSSRTDSESVRTDVGQCGTGSHPRRSRANTACS